MAWGAVLGAWLGMLFVGGSPTSISFALGITIGVLWQWLHAKLMARALIAQAED